MKEPISVVSGRYDGFDYFIQNGRLYTFGARGPLDVTDTWDKATVRAIFLNHNLSIKTL